MSANGRQFVYCNQNQSVLTYSGILIIDTLLYERISNSNILHNGPYRAQYKMHSVYRIKKVYIYLSKYIYIYLYVLIYGLKYRQYMSQIQKAFYSIIKYKQMQKNCRFDLLIFGTSYPKV